MIGVDTNVLVRYIMQDDPLQARLATRFISGLSAESPGHVSAVALAELSWVLSTTYKASREELSQAIRTLLDTKAFVVERAGCARRALAMHEAMKAGFADALIEELDREAGCEETVTLDKKASAHAGMRLLT